MLYYLDIKAKAGYTELWNIFTYFTLGIIPHGHSLFPYLQWDTTMQIVKQMYKDE